MKKPSRRDKMRSRKARRTSAATPPKRKDSIVDAFVDGALNQAANVAIDAVGNAVDAAGGLITAVGDAVDV